MKPLAIDLFCGLGGWAEGFLAEGYDVFGFDIERHDYGTGGYPGQLVLQDVRTLHGAQFKDADVIVASPPCQFFSRMAMPFKMPWKQEEFERRRNLAHDLFWQCWRIQHEAGDIPLIVENVNGAQRWVGQSRLIYGSFHLWGDVPALMPQPVRCVKSDATNWRDPGLGHGRHGQRKNTGGSWFSQRNGVATDRNDPRDGTKRPGISISAGFNNFPKDENGAYKMPDGTKVGGDWFRDPKWGGLSSRSMARKIASAQIAKIPLPLAQHIARVFKPC